MNFDTITMIEATTRYINVDVFNGDRSRMDLEGFVAFLSIQCDGSLTVRRQCEIADNIVSVKLKPQDTLGKYGHDMQYEIRIVDNETNTALAIKTGKIKVNKSIDPVLNEEAEKIEKDCNK